MDSTPAVAVAVEAQSLSHPQDPSGKEATMVAAPAERGEVSPSSSSTPTESPAKGGVGAKTGQSKRERRSAFAKNTATATRLKNAGYETPVAAMFVKSTAIAETAEIELAGPQHEAEVALRGLAEAADELTQAIAQLLALCRYLNVDIEAMLGPTGPTLSELKSRKVSQAVDSAFRLVDRIMRPSMSVPEALRHEAKALLKSAKACASALETRNAKDRDLASRKEALAAAIKASSDDYALLAAELRHSDARYGTSLTEQMLRPQPPTKRRQAPVSSDPTALKDSKVASG